MKQVYIIVVKNNRFVVDNRLLDLDDEKEQDLLKVHLMNGRGFPFRDRFILKKSSDVYFTLSNAELEANRRNEILKTKFDSKYLRDKIIVNHKTIEFCEKLNIVKSRLAADCEISLNTIYRDILNIKSLFKILGYLNAKGTVSLNEFLSFTIDNKHFELDNSLDFIYNSNLKADLNALYSRLNLNNALFASIAGINASTLRTFSLNPINVNTILYLYWVGKQIEPNLLLSDFISYEKIKEV